MGEVCPDDCVFPVTLRIDRAMDCVWPDCRNPAQPGWAICIFHGTLVWREFDMMLAHNTNPTEHPQPANPLVYYLTLSPTTVKIGTSKNLLLRLKGLRTDLQYVLAVEPGGHELEAQRHRQFAAERLSRREDFRVSELLQQHINWLRSETHSDDILASYRTAA